jgi:SAM-dependent methyltransferase
MPSTDSEASEQRYGFSFAWESPYGHVLQLIEQARLRPGLIIDLGCGVAPLAEPLIERGFQYVGGDVDEEALAELERRGLDGQRLDLSGTAELPAALAQLAGERPVAAVLLLDVIEHMPVTQLVLRAVRDALDALGRPPLFVSVPNIAHTDVAAKLSFGRWDYTRTGLLDGTHVQLFTAARLREEAHDSGLLELLAHDFKLRVSDQHFPTDHPALAAGSPVAQAIRMWREAADTHGETIQFVRAFVCANTRPASETDVSVRSRPLTVVVRTQGRRTMHLRDALTCLAAQTVDDFEVLLMVHAPDQEPAIASMSALVREFDETFAGRVRIVHVAGGGRARPLNAALELLEGEYVAFLDDDDLVTADWVEAFLEQAADGAVVRSVAAVRHVSPPAEDECAPFKIHSGLEFPYSARFDRVHHMWENETPICTFAVPRGLIETLALSFDEQLPVLEDWDFLMRCVAFAEVCDTAKVTSVYQMWRGGESSASLHDATLWRATQRVLQGQRNALPVVLPAGSTDRLVEMSERLVEREHFERAFESAQEWARTATEAAQNLTRENETLRAELGWFSREYTVTVNSRRWRLMGPPLGVLRIMRRLLGRGR